MDQHQTINLDDPAGKTVGRRVTGRKVDLQERGRQLFRQLGYRVCEPGVFRFNSVEEADEWMMQQAAKRSISTKAS